MVGRFGKATPEQAEQAVAAATAAFPAWRDTEPAKRADYLCKRPQIMRRRRFELAAWEVYECGKPWREADADVAEAIDFCDYYAQEMLRLAEPQRRRRPRRGERLLLRAARRGRRDRPVELSAGHPVRHDRGGPGHRQHRHHEAGRAVVRHRRQAHGGLPEAGLPPGVVNFLPGVGEEIGPTLVDHPDVALVAFTGSRGVGLLHQSPSRRRLPAGQDHIKRVIAEMGGKNAIIVDDDADLDEAVHGVVDSAFGYQGQKCSACSRAIVLEPMYDHVPGPA